MALRCEVDLTDDRLDRGGQSAGGMHRPNPRIPSPCPTDPELAIEIAIEIATTVSDELVAAFDRLIPQLSSSSPPPGRPGLQTIVDDRDSVLDVARIGGQIVGSLTLAMYRIPTGLKAWIEDVVVDEAARGPWDR